MHGNAVVVPICRILDVTTEVTCPPNFVPSGRTLGEDMRRRILRACSGMRTEEWFTRTAERETRAAVDAFEVTIEGEPAVEIVRERDRDRLIGLHVRVRVTGGA